MYRPSRVFKSQTLSTGTQMLTWPGLLAWFGTVRSKHKGLPSFRLLRSFRRPQTGIAAEVGL